MAGQTHEQSVSLANKTIIILAAITIFEVAFALFGKGHLVSGVEFPSWIMGGMMIILSIVKAYLIINEFMHMKYEAKGLALTVILPLALLIWAVIAFSMEGSYWQKSRNSVKLDGGQEVYKPATDAEIKMISDKANSSHKDAEHNGAHH